VKNNLSKNNWLRGVMVILPVHESIFVRWGFVFSIVLLPKYKLYLCHTPIKPDLLCFPKIDVFAWSRDHEIHIIGYRSLAPFGITLLSGNILFISCMFFVSGLILFQISFGHIVFFLRCSWLVALKSFGIKKKSHIFFLSRISF